MVRFFPLLAVAAIASSISSAAYAVTFRFDENPAGILNLTEFDVNEDVFSFNPDAFPGVSEEVSFFNGLAQDLTDGFNVIVLQNADDDNNPATAFNARSAARLISAQIDQDVAGFFVYFNSVLNINRLVYSANLNNGEGALDILAAILAPTGSDAVDALPTFTAGNFDISSEIPWQTDAAAGGSVLLLGSLAYRRVRKNQKG
jgi:hypothetical protein